jgi:uncharacterized phage protein (TIGR02218 family)
MKVIPIALAPHYALETTTLCHCLKVTRADGVVLGFTSLDQALTVSALGYEPGFDVAQIISSANLGVDNLELTILPDDATVTEADLLGGLWNNAAFEIFEVNYLAPADGINVLKRGTTGEVQLRRGSFVVEFRGLTQGLQQSVGMVTQKTCRANFADFPAQRLNAPCRLDPADWTVTGTLTSVTSNQVFADSGRTEPADWFTEGIITWTDGLNEGLREKVKLHAVGGALTLSLPMPFEVQVGDAYSLIAGCRKRHDVDCRDKFDNILNFQGEPHLAGIDAITGAPDTVG